RPSPSDMKTTVEAMAMAMPRAVRTERSGRWRSDATAKPQVTEPFNWVKPRSAVGGPGSGRRSRGEGPPDHRSARAEWADERVTSADRHAGGVAHVHVYR